MAGPCVWLCVLVSMLMADPTTATDTATSAPSPQTGTCGTMVSSILQAAGRLLDCVNFALGQFTSLYKEMLEILRELRPGQPRHCQDLLEEGDTGRGIRQIYPFPGRSYDVVDVYCDHTIDGGGWTVFQHRVNLTTREDFYRTWAEYKLGFGNLTGEFWLGLELLHALTSSSLQQMRVELADYDGMKRWAKYGVFNVGPSEDNYRLSVGRYTGDAGDAMRTHNGRQFSTHDADHDTSNTTSCATNYKGAWWYAACHNSNPNGYQYKGAHKSYADGINWKQWRGYKYSLMNTTFMIRPAF